MMAESYVWGLLFGLMMPWMTVGRLLLLACVGGLF